MRTRFLIIVFHSQTHIAGTAKFNLKERRLGIANELTV